MSCEQLKTSQPNFVRFCLFRHLHHFTFDSIESPLTAISVIFGILSKVTFVWKGPSMIRQVSVFTVTLLALCLLQPAAKATQQSQFDIVGVSKDLSMMGVSEVWTSEETGLKQCEVRLYNKNQWNVAQARTVTSEGLDEAEFKTACDGLKTKATKKFHLYDIEWEHPELSPAAASVKDKDGNLLENAVVLTHYPTLQTTGFTLPDNALWQTVVRSEKQNDVPSQYTFVLRNPDEPMPYR
jgi:hypothetical protein